MMLVVCTKYLLLVQTVFTSCEGNPRSCKAPLSKGINNDALSMVQRFATKMGAKAPSVESEMGENSPIVVNYTHKLRSVNSFNKVTSELVVAVCTENISWLAAAANQYVLVTVYDKCFDVRQADLDVSSVPNVLVQPLENIGSCDFAYLTYILDRWDSLPDIVEFTKGAPSNEHYTSHGFDPLPCTQCDGVCDERRVDNIRWASTQRKGSGTSVGFSNATSRFPFQLPFNFAFPNSQNHRRFANNNITVEFQRSGYENMGAWIDYASTVSPLSRQMYTDACCARNYGGHFTATREQIINEAYFQGRARELYLWLRDQQRSSNEEVDHFIERTWWSVFCAAHR